jgi:hypothetical protein
MKTIDLRRQQISIDELLESAGADVVRITSKGGDEFLLEAADAFEREAKELGHSAKFMAFLEARSAEPSRVSLAEIESRLAAADPAGTSSNEAAEPNDD